MSVVAEARGPLLTRALRLEYLTVGWNIIEGVVAIPVPARRHRRERPVRLVVGRPAAALGMTVFIGREAIEAWRGDEVA